MDMNKILQNFETAAKGEYTPSKQESSDMKMILESFYEVAADDAKPQQLDEIASVSMSGETADEVAQLIKLLNDAGAPEAAPVGPQPTTMHEPAPCDGPPDMPPKDTMITPKMMDDFETEEEPVAEDDWDNTPEETYDDHEKMTLDLSGGINRRKPKGSIRVKDPANFSENSLAEELSLMLKKKMSEKKDQDGDGDNDFDDVKIARMKASGMSHDEAVAKVKGKKESSKKNSNKEVGEAGKMKGGGDDPCWKGYKMVGTKKKGGKEVPNCVPEESADELENDQIDEISADLAKRVKDKAKASELDHLMKGREKIKRTKNIPFVSKMGRKSADRDLEKARRRKRQANLADRKLGGMGDYEYDDKGRYRRQGPAKVLARRDKNDIEEAAPKNNPVAKHAGKFNKAQVQTDKKKEMKKGKGVKHKGKDMQMESAPVFDRYVKPLLDKSPKQIVEFYDTEAYAIIDRLSRESRTLANQNVNTRVHDSIVGKLRENLSVLPETKLDEMRRRRSSFDIGRTGYGPGGDLGAADKRDFKRREMEVELGDEEPSRSRRPQLKGMYFYDVPPGKEEEARALGIKPTKSGKMAMKIYDTSGRSTSYRKNLADEQFGPGKYWSPKR